MRLLLTVCLLFAAVPVWAQPVTDGGEEAVRAALERAGLGATRDTLRLSAGSPFTLSSAVVPGTATVLAGGEPVDGALFTLDEPAGRLSLGAAVTAEPVVVIYRPLAVRIPSRVARRDLAPAPTSPDSADRPLRIIERATAESSEADLFGTGGLQRRGSITRGITTGNRRDVSLESGLRLELTGEVAEGVQLQAVLTDENTPIQPDGSTQRLSELDRVYIQLDARAGQARLGDVDLAYSGSEFARFSRKVQGAAVAATVPRIDGFGANGLVSGGRVSVAGAVARGLYQSQEVPAVEAVQGPYRLRGRSGEAFIVVLAGTEQVYLDGELLQRGASADYVIDYATAEVTFTPRRLITAERRIQVDFEYTTTRFTRGLVGADAAFGFLQRREDDRPRATLGVTVLRESDGQQFADEQGLSEADLDAIAAAGDAEVFVDGATAVEYDPEAPFVLYARRDTTLAGITYAYFTPANPSDGVVFRVRFSRVAEGAGQYRRGGQTVNGVVYTWVGPAGGDYVARQRLPKPALKQVVDVRGTAEPIRGVELFGEWAQSTNDANTLSGVDRADDVGGAYVGGLRLKPLDVGMGEWSGEVRRRVRSARFATFDRLRSVDFNRTWNLARTGASFGSALDTLREATTEGELRWAATDRSSVQLEAGRLDLGGEIVDGTYEADRYGVEGRFDETERLALLPRARYRADLARSTSTFAFALAPGAESLPRPDGEPPRADCLPRRCGETGFFFRQQALVDKPFWQRRLTPSIGYDEERREQALQDGAGLDSLTAGSFAFRAVRPGLAWATEPFTAAGSVEFRREEEPLAGRLQHAADALTVSTEAAYRGGIQADGRVAYRTRRFTDSFEEEGRLASESLALQGNVRATPLQRALDLRAAYEALTERTAVPQETYVLVGSELGEYVWVDGNGDGVPQVDEFQPEPTPNEGTYALTFVPGDDLRPTIGVQAQLRLRFDASRLVSRPESRLQRFLAGVQTQTTVDVSERSTLRELARVYLLDPAVLQSDSTTLSGRFRVTQDLSLFRRSDRVGVRLFGSHLTSTSQLAAGQEERLQQEARVELDGRPTAGGRLSLRLALLGERAQSTSGGFASRRFDIRTLGAEPEATLRIGGSLSVTAGLAYSVKENAAATGPSEATVFRVPVRSTLSLGRRLQVSARAERADVRLDTDAVTGLAAFELTDGRGPGVSYLWGGTVQYAINTFLRASAFYDGRLPSDAPAVHTVRAQVSAVF